MNYITKKNFQTNQFVIINGIPFFRKEDGKISVEKVKNTTINCSKEDKVELILVEDKAKILGIWKCKNEIYALTSASHLTIPEDAIFDDYYYSPNYLEGLYLKYISSLGCGVIYVSETSLCNIISYNKGYTEICYENQLFYAKRHDCDKYDIISESCKVMGTFSSKCKKVQGYNLFYDKNRIYIEDFEVEIPNGILSVEIIKYEEFQFVKVVNKKGIYYYNKQMEYLFGPVQSVKFEKVDGEFGYLYAIVDKKIINVCHLKSVRDGYICNVLSSKNGIIFPESCSENIFFLADNKVYMLINDEFSMIYSLNFEQAEKIAYIDKNSCYIYSIRNEIIKKVLFLKFLKCGCIIDNVLEAKNSIESINDELFVVDNKEVYALQKNKFVKLISNENIDAYKIYGCNSYNKNIKCPHNKKYLILGMKDNKPIYSACYSLDEKKIFYKGNFQKIDLGYTSQSFVCQKDKSTIIINDKDFICEGGECYFKKCKGIPIYLMLNKLSSTFIEARIFGENLECFNGNANKESVFVEEW